MEQETKASVTFSNNMEAVKEEVPTEPVLGLEQNACLSFEEKKGKNIISDQDSYHQKHKWTEQNRRKRISGLISTLRQYLPRSPEKLDQATVVEETVRFIESLNCTIETLQKRKLYHLRRTILHHQLASSSNIQEGVTKVDLNVPPTSGFSEIQSWESPNISYSIYGEDAHIRVCAKRRLGLLTSIIEILQKRGVHVLSVQISSHEHFATFIIHARASGTDDQSSNILPNAEVIYNGAVRELAIMLSILR